MPEDKLYQLFTTLQQDENYDVGTDYDVFKSSLTDAKAQELYSVLSTDENYDVGQSFDEFSNGVGLKKKEVLEDDSQLPYAEGVPIVQDSVPQESPSNIPAQPNQDFFPEVTIPTGTTNTALGDSALSPVDQIDDRWNEMFPMISPIEADDKEFIKAEGERRATEQLLKDTPAGTIGELTSKYGVSPRDLGFATNDVNLDRQISKYDEERFKRLVQTKLRVDTEQNPDKYIGMFGADITKDSYGLGFIKASAVGVGAEVLNTLASAGETIGDWLGIEQKDGFLRTTEANIRYVADTELPDMPSTVVGKTIEGGVYLSELLLELAATPTIKLFNAAKLGKGVETLSRFGFINAKGSVVVPKLATQMAGHNFVRAYAEGLDNPEEGSPTISALKDAGVGVGHAAVFLSLGYASGVAGQLVSKYGAGAKLAAGTLTDGLGFTGFGFANSMISTGEYDPKQLGADFILGAGLYMSHYTGKQKNVSDAVAERASLRYFTSTPETINQARSSTKTIAELRNEAVSLRTESKDIADPAVKAFNQFKADLADGMADIKAVDDMVAKHPDVYKDTIKKDDRLDAKQKEILTQRIDEIVAEKKIIEAEKTQFKEGDIIQSQNTEKGKSVKGEVKKTLEGVSVKDDLMGEVELKTKDDVLIKKEETKAELKEVEEELAKREKVDKEAPYRIGGETFKTKEEFIEGLKQLASKGNMDSELISDMKNGDVPLTEVLKVLNENSPKADAKLTAPRVEATSEQELISRQEMLTRRLERLDVADNVISGKLKKKPEPAKSQPKESESTTTTTEQEKVPTIEDKVPSEVKESARSLAALRSQDKVMSLDPKVEELKVKLAEAKNEPKRMQEMIKNFLKENKESIAQAQIKATDITALVKANTWDKVAKAIKNMSTRLKDNTPRYRADSLLDILNSPKDIREQIKKEAVEKGLKPKSTEYNKYVREQYAKRNPFQDIPETVYQNMVKKATEASLSDSKLKQAEQYIDKALTDAAFVRHEAERMDYVDKITTLTAPKKILQKGQRGGSSPKVKKEMLSYSGDTSNIDALQTVGELVTKGTSKKYADPAKKALENQDRMEEIREKIEDMSDPKKTEGMADDVLLKKKAELDAEMEKLMDENSLLEYAGVRDMELYRLKEKLEDVEAIRNDQKTKSQTERAERKKLYSELADKLVNEDIKPKLFKRNPKTGAVSPIGNAPTRTAGTLFLRNTNFWSLNDIVMAKSNYKSGTLRVFDNRLNAHYEPIVSKAQNTQARRELDFHHEWVTRLGEIFGMKEGGKLDRTLIDLQSKKSLTTTLKHTGGEQIIELTPAQAIQKILQWRSADGRRSMEKVGDEQYMMGYTQEAITKLEAQLQPKEVKLMEFLVETMDKYSTIYDQAYIKENGVSMKTVDDFYWTLTKYKETPVLEDLGGIHINPQVRKDRTIRRTKDSSPLKHGSAIEDVLGFAAEAIRYEAWATPLRELQYIYKDPHFRKAVATEYGTDAVRQMDDNIKAFIGTLPKDRMGVLDNISGAYATAILGLKAMPAVNQVAGSVYYMMDMPLHEFAKAVAKTQPGYRWEATEMALRKYLSKDVFVEERRATSKTAYGEEQSSLATRVSKSDASPTWEKFKSYFPTRKIKEASGTPLREMDLAPIVGIGSGYVEFLYKKYSGKSLTKDVIDKTVKGETNVHFERAVKDWRFLSEVTQQSLRTSNRSAISKSSSIGRSISLFTSGQASIHRVVSSMARDAVRSIRTNGWNPITNPSLTKNLWGIAVGHVLGGATFGFLNGITLPNTDTEKVLRSTAVGAALGNIDGLFFLGRVIQMVKSSLSDNPWGKDFKVQLLPVMRNIENIWKYGNEVYDLTSATNVDEQSVFDASVRLATSASIFTGLPIDGLMRLYNAGDRTIDQIQQDIAGGKPVPSIVGGAAKELVKNKAQDSVFRPDTDVDISKFESFQDAKDAAKSYMVFNEGNFVKFADYFREPDKQGTFSIAVQGLNEFCLKAAASGFPPKDIINAAFTDKIKERLARKYEVKRGLNTIEEIETLLNDPSNNMTGSDQRALVELLKEWYRYDVTKQEVDGQRQIWDIYRKGVRITEKDVIEK